MDSSMAETLLRGLGSALETEEAGHVDILICGSMAMILQGVISRRTRDIDGAAFVSTLDGELVLSKPYPSPAFRRAIERVGSVHNVQKHWLSFQSKTLLDDGLPDGILERASTRDYGSKLTVRLISRYDMILLKMKAAVARGGIDIEDLSAMNTTQEEVSVGFLWCLEQGYPKESLLEVLEKIGHGELAKRFA